ncbi:MAG TPA: glycosyltransferase family A protein [Candidatus Paceibacterota bacterium]|nr:glycosyltransferase family A protein [Candidatus Paceibacterota bacterium]
MKISVLIIAHNEEKYIKGCIESILDQTKHPDEIVLLVHNSTDKTKEIAEDFPITVAPFNGNEGIINARIEGLNHVSGDIILCIDGDSFAQNNWVVVMSDTLKNNNNVLVGSWVKFKGAIFGLLYNFYSRYSYVSKKQTLAYWMWGSSLAFWGKDKKFVQEIIKNSVVFFKKLSVPSNLEDYWLAMIMNKRGNIEVTNKTYITTSTKKISSWKMILRAIRDRKSKYLMSDYFKSIKGKNL